MSSIAAITKLARRRAALQLGAQAIGPALLAGSIVGLGSVAIARTFGDSAVAGWRSSLDAAPWWLLLGVPVVVSVAGAITWALVRTAGSQRALAALCRAESLLGLNNQISSAGEFARSSSTGSFELAAIRQGESVASGVSAAQIARVMPVRFGRSTPWAAVVLAGGVVAGVWMPSQLWSNWFPQGPGVLAVNETPTPAAIKDAVSELATVRNTIEPATPAAQPSPADAVTVPSVTATATPAPPLFP
ncbi:MAG: hypothetical protein K2X32_10945, partial [Phycisphaerales bacterium]|nr:hypothetical protein [Phycisphaerales bacterium]